MVGQGLLTPEDLVDIHRIGDAMDAVRPDLALAVAEADRAVTRSARRHTVALWRRPNGPTIITYIAAILAGDGGKDKRPARP